jgi:ABC-2 type transport system ATP-binding protein
MKSVNKRYPPRDALLHVNSMTIPKGEIVGILGENGSGKTTLLKSMMGIGEIWSGEITYEGKSPLEMYDRIAFVTEEGSFLPDLTPNRYGQFLADFFPRFDREYFDELLKAYELPADRRIRTFSKGQKMKLELSAGLAKRPDYLLMDEPFVGKDVFSRRDSLKRIVEGLTGSETVLLSTHLIDEIENVIDRAIVLHKGLVRADFYVDDMRQRGLGLADIMLDVRTAKNSHPFHWPEG